MFLYVMIWGIIWVEMGLTICMHRPLWPRSGALFEYLFMGILLHHAKMRFHLKISLDFMGSRKLIHNRSESISAPAQMLV